MNTQPLLTPPSGFRLWSGIVVTGLVALFLSFDGLTKVIRVAPVVKASEKLGLPSNSIIPIGIVLLACTVAYVIPKTSLVGAILLTGYLGGAVAIHVSARSGAFPIGFSLGCGALVWLGLFLREPKLTGLIFLR